MFDIDIYALQHNPEEWIEPEKFIPERFDPASPYYLTPKGTKRHPMSFGPFFGGKRACLGKTFAETMARVFGTILLYKFDFAFVDEKHYTFKPANHVEMAD